MTIDLRDRGIRAVVLDIEGTTTPLAFVHDVLFPYARRHLHAHLARFLETPDSREWLLRFRAEWTAEASSGAAPPEWEGTPLEAATAYASWLMDRDRKSPALKSLQGLIWERGYREGELKGEVYPDVPRALERWHAAGIEIAIYSSGSVLAQRLLFGATQFGNLTPFLTSFFDTEVGPKTSPESYRKIAAALEQRAAEVLFLSDVAAELDAARTAGMAVALCVRPGNSPQPATDAPILHDLDDV